MVKKTGREVGRRKIVGQGGERTEERDEGRQ